MQRSWQSKFFFELLHRVSKRAWWGVRLVRLVRLVLAVAAMMVAKEEETREIIVLGLMGPFHVPGLLPNLSSKCKTTIPLW